jgi:di/tricarboxylate transporter
MTAGYEAWIVFGVLAGALVLFVGGWWRYDIVALLALLVLTVVGIVPGDEAFSGFGHPAVITVAAVLVISRGMTNAGVINPIARRLAAINDRPLLQLAALTGVVAVCSAFMNNVGALALFMPVAIAMSRKSGRPASMLLMPLAFGSLLGGLMTLIGTPPNIIIATYRADVMDTPFGMFDFAPVGAAVAIAGVVFISLIGWRLIPQRKGQASPDELFDISEYLTEVRVTEKSKVAGKPLAEIGRAAEGAAVVVGLQRGNRKIAAPPRFEILRPGDVLTIEIEPDALEPLIDETGLELPGPKDMPEHAVSSEEIVVVEAVVSPGSMMIGRTVEGLNLRWRYGMNLLAVARQGQRIRTARGGLRQIRFQPGDILLLQAEQKTVHESLSVLGCLPLADRELQIGRPRRVIPALAIFGAAILLTVLGLLPVQIAFAGAALLMVAGGLVALRTAYEAIDWPVIVLLAAMIPVGVALETTGGAGMVADGLLVLGKAASPAVMLLVLLVVTMFLSDLINNAAAAVLMAPIAIGLSEGLDVSADPFLMAVAVGASCAFLTPIGHQSNTLVMGPGGYRFGDYWRMGLPLEIVIAAVAVPMILWVWPL